MNFRLTQLAIAAATAYFLTAGCEAQPRPQLPPPEATDPVALKLMEG